MSIEAGQNVRHYGLVEMISIHSDLHVVEGPS
jgi:hypothetical protein